jgi:predicted protein tyrosine phosphatase
MPTVTFLPLIVATSLTDPSNIISIRDDDTTLPWAVDHRAILSLKFDDIDHEVGPEYKLFDYWDAMKVLAFVRERPLQDIVVHCHAGVSRSAAIAKWLSEKKGYTLKYHPMGSTTLDLHNSWVYRCLTLADFKP